MRAPGPARAAAIGALLAAALPAAALPAAALPAAALLTAGCGASASPPNVAPAAATAVGASVLASYRAPLGCPTQQEYLGYVASRSARLQLLPEAQVEAAMLDAATRVRVRIQPDSASAGWIGALRIEGALALEREVRGERCQDVAQALALIAVLRLDERAGEAPGALPSAAAERAGAGSSGAEPAPAAPLPSAAAEQGAAPAAAPEAVTGSENEQAVLAEQGVAAEAAAAAASEAAAAAAASAAVSAAAAESKGAASAASEPVAAAPAAERIAAPVSNALPAEERQLDVGSRATEQRGSELQPVIVAQAGYAAAPSHALQAQLLGELRLGRWVAGLAAGYSVASESNSEADLGFQLFTAQLSLCPVGGELSVFWWRACAELEGGALRVSVSARDPSLEPEASTRPWFALGPSLQAGWPFARQWALRAAAGGSLMLVRDRFQVERDEGGEGGELQKEYNTLYRPPPLSFELLLGLSYAF